MMRRFAWLLVIAGACFTNLASAVGLGELKLHSALNQPLSAEIKLLNTGDLSKNELLPNLASHEDFARAGVERVFFLTGIKFDVQFKDSGDVVINLKTDRIVREPFLNFLVEIHWPNGKILREYTVLLDPPIFSETAPAAVAQAATAKPAPAPQRISTTPTRATPRAAPITRSSPPASQGGDKVVIKKNDTLWGIARDNRPDSDLSIRQTMMAIQRENPHAFIDNNINLIRAGQVLRVPSASEIRSISSGEAFAETRRQNAEWREKRVVASASEDEDVVAAAPVSEAPDDGGGVLKLVGDDIAGEDDQLASTATGAAGEGEGEVTGESGYGLTEASSSSDVATGSTVSAAKVAELESQLEDMKRLVALKDQQLALLQASAANDADAAGAESTQNAANETKTATPATADAAKADGGMLALITENPIYIGVAILLFLAILVIMGAMSRRKSDDEEYPIGLQSAIEESETEVDLPDDFVEEFDNEAADLDDLESVTESPAQEAAVASGDDEAEAVRKVIEEAEIYVAYGRSERALEILEPAVQEYPNNAQLALKMAEVSIAMDDAEGLASQEAKLQEIGDGEAIQQLQGLKRAAQQAADADALGEEAEQDEADDDILAAADDLDDLDDVADEPDATPDNVVEFDAAASAQKEEAEPLEFSLDDDADAASEQDVAAVVAPDEEQEEAEPTSESADVDDEDFLGDTDESATKLELARAYIDMADQDAAEDILNEVIEEGNDEQKQKARQLLEGLG